MKREQDGMSGYARIAAAPISWGVCEVPGWGYQMDRERVLREMAELGCRATEFGPDGFLPEDPAERAALLREHGLVAVGGFVPLVLHEPGEDPLPAVERELRAFRACGADVLVLAAATGHDGYEGRPEMDEAAWETLLRNLDRIRECAVEAGVLAVLHPHAGTMIEGADELRRVVEGSEIALCLDTGHLLVGGVDPVAFTAEHADRIAHVHLKDVDRGMAARVRAGEMGYAEAVAAGMYRPLGQGDAGIGQIVASLRASGYAGWLVLEQDKVLGGPPAPGAGPVEDARESIEHLRGLLARR